MDVIEELVNEEKKLAMYEEESLRDVIEYNEKMRNDSDRLSEYLEMEAMYKEGLLEC